MQITFPSIKNQKLLHTCSQFCAISENARVCILFGRHFTHQRKINEVISHMWAMAFYTGLINEIRKKMGHEAHKNCPTFLPSKLFECNLFLHKRFLVSLQGKTFLESHFKRSAALEYFYFVYNPSQISDC